MLKENLILKSDPFQNGEMIYSNWLFMCAGSISSWSEFSVCVYICVRVCVCVYERMSG